MHALMTVYTNTIVPISYQANMMPSMTSLVTDVGLSLPIAFQLTRPLFRAAMQASEDPENVPDALKPWHPFSPALRFFGAFECLQFF